MRKLFITALGAFALILASSLDYQNNNIIENSAFANGTCCKENTSKCIVDGHIFDNMYYLSSGSCKKKPEELTIAP